GAFASTAGQCRGRLSSPEPVPDAEFLSGPKFLSGTEFLPGRGTAADLSEPGSPGCDGWGSARPSGDAFQPRHHGDGIGSANAPAHAGSAASACPGDRSCLC